MSVNKYNRPAQGCYFDHGNYSVDELNRKTVELAMGWGWALSDEDKAKFENEPDADAERSNGPDQNYYEFLNELADEAIDWLNDQETRSYMYWANEGEANAFGLWVNLDGAKEDVEFTSSKRTEYPEDSYEGEWLHVSDHGNPTLYSREQLGPQTDGQAHFKDHEIWSIV